MQITIKYFASLREKQGKSEELIEVDRGTSVADLWRQVSGNRDFSGVLVAINMDYARADSILQADDEVAFFPPVTGG